MKSIILCFVKRPYLQNKNTGEIHNKKCSSLRYAEKKNLAKLTAKKKDRILKDNPSCKCGLCKSV